MAELSLAPNLCTALKKFKEIVKAHCEKVGREGKRLVVFCEDRLSLVAERAVCEEVGGTFCVSVYTFSRFLSSVEGAAEDVLTSQGSAMALSRLVEKNRQKLKLFNRLSSAGAAQDIYDTIALLYASKISPQDLEGVHTSDSLLERKLRDLQLLYGEYTEYLKESGAVDRNAYLRRLPAAIKTSRKLVGADVLIFGYQAFTASVADAVGACIEAADMAYGIFIGGNRSKYVNESWVTFSRLCIEYSNGARMEKLLSVLPPVAERLRVYAFEPECFFAKRIMDIPEGIVNLCECADEDEECELFAAAALKCVMEDGLRYRDISVMLPDLAAYQPTLERVFGEYKIPFYVDRRYPLSSHFACEFIVNYLTCAIDGCRGESVIAAVRSPLFPVDEKDKDHFENYMLRVSSGRGGVRRAVNLTVCEEEGIDGAAAERVRAQFIKGMAHIPASPSNGEKFTLGIKELLEEFGADDALKKLSEEAEKGGYATAAAMSARAYAEIIKVLNECEKLTYGEKYSPKDFLKILRSGFTAAQVSLIPPKQDALFVGDLSACVNAGTKVLMVGGLTGGVPSSSQDTAILTDGELASMEKLKLAVSPKISQVNLRLRETAALNISSFFNRLYLCYPVRSGGEEASVSEIIAYAKRLYTVGGKPMKVRTFAEIASSEQYFKYFNCRPSPALRHFVSHRAAPSGKVSAAEAWLKEQGVLNEEPPKAESGGEIIGKLYGGYVSPTGLEMYFSCPYKVFAERGLKLGQRREGAFRPVDSGNFIHEVLQKTAEKSNNFKSEEECAAYAERVAKELSASAKYAFSEDDLSAKYALESLIYEAVTLSKAAYLQIKLSDFKVDGTEKVCSVPLEGLTVGGRIDRTDVCGDYVRVIDYKTGTVDDKPESYYMGLRLQLPLYLFAASEGKRAAGAYYFPANTDYSPGEPNEFTLKGFMDGSEDVIKHSDVTINEGEKSKLVCAALNGRKSDRTMDGETFKNFLSYSLLLAKEGGKNMLKGEIAPSPIEGGCEFCNFKCCCAYDTESEGERQRVKADCRTIANIASSDGGKNNE